MPTVSPHLCLSNASAAIEFYRKALGAEEVMRMPAQDGKRLMHAAVKIGDSTIMMADEFPEMCRPDSPRSPAALGGTTVTIHINVPDVDATMASAAAAGGTIMMPATDMFWGERYGQFRDPFGHVWSVSTTLKRLTPQEMKEAGDAFFKQAQRQQQQ